MKATSLVLALLIAPLLVACGHTIRPGQRGIKYIPLSGDALKKEVLDEGFYFQWPWNSIVSYDITIQSRDEKVEVLTADELHVPTMVTVSFRPLAKQLYKLHTELGSTYYEDVIGPAFVTLIRGEFSRYQHNNLAKKSAEIETHVLAKLRQRLKGKPLEIDSISIKHIRYEQLITQSVSQKLVKQQQLEQKKFELAISKFDAKIAREKASGSGDAVRIRAKGEAEAIVLKADAQAKAQAAITKTLTKAYLQYKAFDGKSTRYYFVPTGKDALPLIVNAGGTRR